MGLVGDSAGLSSLFGNHGPSSATAKASARAMPATRPLNRLIGLCEVDHSSRRNHQYHSTEQSFLCAAAIEPTSMVHEAYRATDETGALATLRGGPPR